MLFTSCGTRNTSWSLGCIDIENYFCVGQSTRKQFKVGSKSKTRKFNGSLKWLVLLMRYCTVLYSHFINKITWSRDGLGGILEWGTFGSRSTRLPDKLALCLLKLSSRCMLEC